MSLDREKTLRATRLSLTCIVIFLGTWYYQVPESIWSLVTLWFVMTEYTTVGGVYTKGLYRMIGTCASAAYGLLIIYCCGNNPIVDIIALVAGLFVYTYFFLDTDRTYIAIIGTVTLAIVLLNYNKTELAIYRVLNVLIGVLVSMFTIRFFYPHYARDGLIEIQVKFLGSLEAMLTSYLDEAKSLAIVKCDFIELEKTILSVITLYKRLSKEARIELIPESAVLEHAELAMLHSKHLYHFMDVFIACFTTEAMRSDPWVRQELNSLLLTFHCLEKKLSNPRDELTITLSKLELPIQDTAHVHHAIITKMNQETRFLIKEVMGIVR